MDKLEKYDKELRKSTIISMLHVEFNVLNVWVNEKVVETTNSRKSLTPDKFYASLLQFELDRYLEKISNFRKKVEEFSGPCLNKVYRALLATGTKLQCKLDRMDISKYEHIRNQRKVMLLQIENIIFKAKEKVHNHGISCPNCKVPAI